MYIVVFTTGDTKIASRLVFKSEGELASACSLLKSIGWKIKKVFKE